MPEGTKRRLSAILAADVVGYSRLMEADEAGTLETMKAYRADLWGPMTKRHGGRIVGTAGDSLLVEFGSVVAAVDCAIAVQREMVERNADLAEERRMSLRIGVNIGEVIVDGDNIFGEGVNVTARLEALSEPDGVAISGNVHEQVQGKTAVEFIDDGLHEVKNIAKPVQVWRWSPMEAPAAPAQDTSGVASPLPAKPSIAVLPFDNMSTDPELEFFGDGISEDIITTLSKVSGLRVIARNSSFAYKVNSPDVRQVARDLGVRYVLEGSVRGRARRLRITAQLIDAGDGSHLWAERYDRQAEDLFDIQDDITKEIVTNLRVTLTDGEQARTWAHGTDSVQAWHLAVQATEKFLLFSTSEYIEARSLAERSIQLDPNYAHARAIFGFTYWWEARLGFAGDPPALFAKAHEIADQAMALDDTPAFVIGLKSLSLVASGDYEEAVVLMQRGVQLYPGSADVRAFLSFALCWAGHHAEAVDHMHAAIALNPYMPSWYEVGMARSLLMLGRYDEALDHTDRVIAREPDFFSALVMHAALLGRLGRRDASRGAVARIRAVAPAFRAGHVKSLSIARNDESIGPLIDALREAGLPA